MSMKQVPREDFEVLTKYHPGEVRYYVDTAIAIAKNKGARVSVRRAPVSVISHPKRTRTHGKHVQLGTQGIEPKVGTKSYVVYAAVRKTLEQDPTKVMTRIELTQAVTKALPMHSKKSVITPAITTMIRQGVLRYTGE